MILEKIYMINKLKNITINFRECNSSAKIKNNVCDIFDNGELIKTVDIIGFWSWGIMKVACVKVTNHYYFALVL